MYTSLGSTQHNVKWHANKTPRITSFLLQSEKAKCKSFEEDLEKSLQTHQTAGETIVSNVIIRSHSLCYEELTEQLTWAIISA